MSVVQKRCEKSNGEQGQEVECLVILSRYQDDLLADTIGLLQGSTARKWHGRNELVATYERALRDVLRAQYAVACNSGTSAVELGLRALGARPGVTVLLPALAPVMTALPVRECGANVQLYDNEADSTFPDLDGLGQIRAAPGSILVTVSWWGYRAPAEAISRLCHQNGWRWLEDAAQAHGSTSDCVQEHPGIRAYSTHDRKLVTTGEGGFVLTDDPEFARRVRSYASYGGYPQQLDRELELGQEAGANLRLSGFAAALGIASLARLQAVVQRRAEVAAHIVRATGPLGNLRPHRLASGAVHNCYGLVYISPSGHRRHSGARYLYEAGIQNDVTSYDLKPIDEYPVFERFQTGGTPNATSLSERVVMISPHHGLTGSECDFIGQSLAALDRMFA